MKNLKMIETIKEVHEQDVVLIKRGSFYEAYGKDAIILAISTK